MNLIQKWNKNQKKYPTNKKSSVYARKLITEFPSKSHILDLGGGPGADTKLFLKKGFKVTLVDISDYVLDIAKLWAKNNEYELITKRLTLGEEVLDLDEKVDIVY